MLCALRFCKRANRTTSVANSFNASQGAAPPAPPGFGALRAAGAVNLARPVAFKAKNPRGCGGGSPCIALPPDRPRYVLAAACGAVTPDSAQRSGVARRS